MPPRLNSARSAFSLLEVILALTILTASIAVIGELVRIGSRHAEATRDLSQAQLLCESKLAEITSGALAPTSVSSAPCEQDPNWLYSIVVGETTDAGMLEIQVSVSQNLPAESRPVTFTLVQWMIDAEALAAAAEAAASTTSSTSGGTP